MSEAFYLSIANELSAKLRRVAAFVNHGPSIGSYHEESLKSVLRSILPERFGVKTGFAYSAQLGASQQGDILVIDESHPGAYHFREGEFAVALPEAIVAVVEVKTKLTRRTFAEAMTALYSYRKVSTTKNPISYLFAYESQAFTARTLTSWYDAVAVPDEISNYPWAVYALNQGVIILRRDKNGAYGHLPIDGDVTRGPKLKSLSVFLQSIRKAALLYAGKDNNPYEYAALEGLHASNIGYRFGLEATAPTAHSSPGTQPQTGQLSPEHLA